VTIPTLTTPRLVLRPIHNDDVPGYTAIWSDAEFARFIGGPQSDPDRIWHAMAGNIGCWALTGVGPLAVVERDSGDLVGRAGLWDEPGWPGVEAVWFIGRRWWGRGYATEAAEASIAWAFDNRDIEEITTPILPGNVRSRRVAERLGMRVDRTEFLHGYDHVVYVVTRERWERRP
jgi:RimJ/RimL family protein N-acetyltransferase